MKEHGSSPAPAPAFVGIDVSKYRLDVYVRPANSAVRGGAITGHWSGGIVPLLAE
jgi:hypothetical protein